MKRLALLALLGVVVAGTGCSTCNTGCDSGCGRGLFNRSACRGDGRGDGRRGGGDGGDGMAQAAPTVAYPYYTTRGPRDFFACDPGYPRN